MSSISPSFCDVLIHHFQRIVDQSFANLQFVANNEHSTETASQFSEILNKGIWYPQDYYCAAQKANLPDKIEKEHPKISGSTECKLPTSLFFHLRSTVEPRDLGEKA